jgi:hypothetical protein
MASRGASSATLRCSLLASLLVVGLVSGACAISSSAGTTAHSTATTSPATPATDDASGGGTPTPAPTLPASVTNCSQVPGFGGAGPVSVSTAFNEVAFPSGTVGALAQSFETKSYLFEIINACTNNFTASHIRSYFAAALPPTGFAQSATFPYQGNPAAACGDPYCWVSSLPTNRYVSLESIAANGSVVTYKLRLGIAPITGTETIQGTYFGRFDASGVANDVWWEIVTNTPYRQAKMVPQDGAKIVNAGATSFSAYTLNQLKGLSYSVTPLNGNADGTGVLVTNDVFALISVNGHYVKVLVTSIGATPTNIISLQYVVYKVTF